MELPPDQARRYLWNSVLEFLERASRDRPLLLDLEDLHWADESPATRDALGAAAAVGRVFAGDVVARVARPTPSPTRSRSGTGPAHRRRPGVGWDRVRGRAGPLRHALSLLGAMDKALGGYEQLGSTDAIGRLC